MATTTIAADKTTLLNTIKAAASGDVIKIQAGTIEPFFWPANTTKTLTIAPANISNPPQIKSMQLFAESTTYDGNLWPVRNDPKFAQCENVTFDGLLFEERKITTVKQTASDTTPYVLSPPNDGFGGYNWRVDYTWANATGALDNSFNIYGVRVGDECKNLTFQNCTFRGAANAFQLNRPKFIKVLHNRFERNCEDIIKNWGCEDTIFDFNECIDFRGCSLADASNGWVWNGSNPPHSDYFQFACDQENMRSRRVQITHNYLDEMTQHRVHGMYINNNYAAGDKTKYHIDVTITGNEFRMSHTTGIGVGGIDGLVLRGNKIFWKQIPNSGDQNDTKISYAIGANFIPTLLDAPVDVSNNVVRKIYPTDNNTSIPSTWTVQGNKVLNSDTVFPDNWVHIRKSMVAPGEEYTGPYGQGGTPPVVPGDPMQDIDFNMLGSVEDPAFPNDATGRQTGCFEIPPTSIAFAMPSIWWSDAVKTTPVATTYIGLTTGGSKLYRMNAPTGDATYHLKTPGNYLGGIRAYYKDNDGVLSTMSAVSCRFTTPVLNDRTIVHVKPKT